MVTGVPLVPVIGRTNVTTTKEWDFSSTNPDCSLPEITEEYPTFMEDGTDLYTIKEAVEGYIDNSADVQFAIVVGIINIIIFKMNRAAYLKV